jgi:hypothetical protein
VVTVLVLGGVTGAAPVAGAARPTSVRSWAKKLARAKVRKVGQALRRLPRTIQGAPARARDRWRAHREFTAYLDRNPEVEEIYDEEKGRETVHVARRNAGLSLAGAFIAFGITVANPMVAPAGIIALVQVQTQLENQSSKLKKARGTTLERARALSKIDEDIEKPPLKEWLAAGLVRAGDVPRYTLSRQAKAEKARARRKQAEKKERAAAE